MGVRGRCSFQQTGHFLGVSNWQPKPSFFSTRRWHLRSFRSGNTDLPYTLKEPMRFGQDHDGELGNFDESFLFFAGGFWVYCIVFLAEKKILSRGFFMSHHEKQRIHVDCGNFTGVFFHVVNFKTHRLPFFLGRKSQIFSRRRGTTQRRESEERNQEIGDCNTRQFLGEPTDSGWWFQIFHIFTPTWGRFPFWLIFFKWVETTN